MVLFKLEKNQKHFIDKVIDFIITAVWVLIATAALMYLAIGFLTNF